MFVRVRVLLLELVLERVLVLVCVYVRRQKKNEWQQKCLDYSRSKRDN